MSLLHGEIRQRKTWVFTLDAQSKQAFKAARTLITVGSGLHLIATISENVQLKSGMAREDV